MKKNEDYHDRLLEDSWVVAMEISRSSYMSALLARTMTCKCRICKSEYRSLLEATACCKEAKALDRRKTTDSILNTGVKFKTRQSKLGEFHHHEIAWRNLLSELEKSKKSQS